jgi:hypothetical protein
MPTLNWYAKSDPEAHDALWGRLKIRKPDVDDYTVNAVDMPSALVVEGYDGPTGDAFLAQSQLFEWQWDTFTADEKRPQGPP